MTYALVTGASKGIGKAIAFSLAKKKFNILLVARSEDLLKVIAADIKKEFTVAVDYLVVDLSVSTAASQVFEWCNKNNYQVNALINNAGYGLSGTFEKYDAAAYLNMMQLNMGTLISMTHIFLPMLKKQSSYILNIASTAAYQSVPGLGVYAATKSFVLSFSRSLNIELKNTSVSVTCVSPGGTNTDFGIRADISGKATSMAQKVNMIAEDVAEKAVRAMLNKRTEVIIGTINKIGAFAAWLAPKKLAEYGAAKIYLSNK
ncbi:MAG: SDR family oxidoreductase [Ferruginibacter sp.]